jgi:hypothetical protein
MTINHTGADVPASRRPRPEATVEFTLIYAAHDAFRRDPLCLTAPAGAGQTQTASAPAQGLAAHMRHEEDPAPPLVEAHLGARGGPAVRKAAGKSQELTRGAEFLPWMLGGASATASRQVLTVLSPPARLPGRAAWRRRYARTPAGAPRRNAASIRTTAERQAS